jgi:hypothetical protein
LPSDAHSFRNDTVLLFEPNASNEVGLCLRQALGTGSLLTLENCMADLLMRDVNGSMISQIIACLGSPELRGQLFGLFMMDETSALRTVNASYHHDNGFEKWVLINHPDFKLRLHVYEASSLIPQENRHNHAWDFASYIIEGCLENTFYELDDLSGEELLMHYQYSPVQGGAYHTELLNPSQRLRRSANLTLSGGRAYFLPAAVIHRINSEHTFKQRTSTLMLTGKRRTYHCDLFAEKEFVHTETPTRRMSLDHLHHRIETLSYGLTA